MIRAKGISRDFGRFRALPEMSLEVSPGEIVALVGPNGAGKTTLLRILATLITPSRGDAWIEKNGVAHSVTHAPLQARNFLGWAPASADGGFFPSLTGEENLFFYGSLRGLSPARVSRQIAHWKKNPSIAKALHTQLQLCSTGMKQSLVLIRALLGEPPVVLLDEPTRSLDQDTAEAFRQFLKETRTRRALLFSTHSMEEARSFATRQIRLTTPEETLSCRAQPCSG